MLWPIDSIENHTFFPQTLRDAVVVDLGANRGRFSTEIARRYDVRCHGVEPNPHLFASLPGSDRVRFHNLAVCGADGPVTLHLSTDVTSSSVVNGNVPSPDGSVQIPGRTLSGFLQDQQIGRIALMKVDIEGAEVGMFESTSDELLRQIEQITIEFHDDHRLMTWEQFDQIRRRLLGLGFAGIQFASNNTNWLFYQPGAVGVGAVTDLYVRHVIRNVRGVLRKAGFRNN